jgi:regulatory protein
LESEQEIPVNPELYKKLQKKAGALLARRAYSRGEIRQKLLKAADAPLVETVLDRLEELKLLNDREYAYNFALYRVGPQGWGPEKIREALYRHRISESDISAALDRIRSAVGEDYAVGEYLKRLFSKKGTPRDSSELRNLVGHLHRRGYDQNSIIGALKQTLPPEMSSHLQTGD